MATQDFSMNVGDTKYLDVSVRDPSTGDAVAITAATITWKVYHSKGRAVVLTKSTSSGITITDGAGGVFRVTIAIADTASLEAKDYVHEWKITFSDTTVIRGRGRMTLEPSYS
jgi:hypothetical protein